VGSGRTSYIVPRIADGRLWSQPRSLTYEFFTNPNASCPVCGAPVYFYQSSQGGRVFFDELGPPWPKHPCTDNSRASGRSSTDLASIWISKVGILRPEILTARPAISPENVGPHEWRPLIIEGGEPTETVGNHVRFPVDSRMRLPGGRLYLPYSWYLSGPVYWRWDPSRVGWIQLSTVEIRAQSTGKEATASVPGWLRTDPEFEAWRTCPEADPSPEQMNAVGWAFSFVWKSLPGSGDWTQSAGVDLWLARRCFRIAAKRGCWQALNNLGVIYETGLGVDSNPRRAFQYYNNSANSGELIPLKHLARCYREGIGCAVDLAMAHRIETKIAEIEAAGS